MKSNTNANLKSLLTIALSTVCVSSLYAQDSVEYEFEYVAEWSNETHPPSIPGNAHLTPAVGMTHNDAASLWAPGTIASDGVERIAELGLSPVLQSEIDVFIADGNADEFRNLGGIGSPPDTRVRNFTVSKDYSRITLLSMIAPSPDWFVGVHDLDLRVDGIWAREIVVDIFPYDSGTDAGINYGSANSDITPHIPIANISDVFPFEGKPRIGTFRFTLLSDAACSVADFAEPFNELNFFDVSAFLQAFSNQDTQADLNNDGVFNFFDVSDFLAAMATGCP